MTALDILQLWFSGFCAGVGVSLYIEDKFFRQIASRKEGK